MRSNISSSKVKRAYWVCIGIYSILEGYFTSSIVAKFSLIVLGDTNLCRRVIDPALSFVPLAREPPKGWWPGIAPVHWSLHVFSTTRFAPGILKWGIDSLDVEISSRKPKLLCSFNDSVPVVRKDGAA
jgi:hypothetical protein